jgi:hypothetical protein
MLGCVPLPPRASTEAAQATPPSNQSYYLGDKKSLLGTREGFRRVMPMCDGDAWPRVRYNSTCNRPLERCNGDGAGGVSVHDCFRRSGCLALNKSIGREAKIYWVAAQTRSTEYY